ncbi:MlaE family ABC transporter permease [Mycobacteroides abscessus]|uniref:MlaE family ABC transporter permease n=1 Tax=Mycobacteroides abscessus TaxID=36809 RepID=UPI000926F18B|nr:ABC transporter permease [Mycobacteroides abscessus]SKS08139.1 ABC-transporter integral membrane protein [Mycobacteroides abscessus subsp. abscessus]SHU87177.1 ABC-transporter integral membrane protein [Mycobacteroides abscessus subsp. bolletii]SHW22249.1 ABC-transporter integral membrane protein [Mycobacteroides abscessus subsp. bolletii]SHW47268.1 ABC-transporter integral membrane protein [Mycobacteroides abscessus subsp. bolletii]SHX91738.1 ABC-transporter integral membrane protein [Myco
MKPAVRVARYRPLPSITGRFERVVVRPAADFLVTLGRVVLFVGTTVWLLPSTVRWYPRQTIKILNNLAWGRGAIIVDGGVVSTMLLIGFGIGAMVSIEAFAAMDMIGFGALTGVVGGLANVREMGPIAAGIAFAAQAGCRMTAEVGAMRVSEEIDAIESLGIRSIPFVVGTRLLGGMLCVAPAYLATLLLSFVVSRTLVTVVHSQSPGTYHHYFVQFLDPVGLAYSLIKAVVFCAVVTLIHCYFGFFTTGGPAGVGVSSGRAIRASLVMIIVLDLALSIVMWGLFPQYVFRG